MGGVVKIRVFAEDGATHRDVALHTRASDDARERAAGLAASESSSDPLFALRGAYGFDGGGLPPESLGFFGVLPTAPAFVESYPRAEPLVEGGAHVELAAQTRAPATVYWALAVPWTRADGASWWRRRRAGPTDHGRAGTHRMVLDNRTFVAQNVSVCASSLPR